MENDEVELQENQQGKEYEVVPLTPIRRLEKKVDDLEKAGSIPQLQQLISQIVDLIRGNQKLIDSIVHADADLRNELSKIPPKIDDLARTMKDFIGLVEAAGREEISTPGPEAMRPIVDELKKMSEQNQRIVENNQAVLESLDNINRKLKSGTPVSQLLSAYPGMKLRKEGP